MSARVYTVLSIRCPKCDSPNVRSSLTHGVLEAFAEYLGMTHLRCKDCDHRFSTTLWDLRNLMYARCPQCYRLDLSMWRPEQYHTPGLWRFWLLLGAKPHRCEGCRRNFISFRPCKAKYVKRKVKSARSGRDDGENTATE